MAKPKLTKEAIRYIASLYNSETENHTFSEIKNKIKEKYGIEVSLQAVQQNYHKYMEDLNKGKKVANLVSIQNKNAEASKKSDDIRPTPTSSSTSTSSTSNIFGAFTAKKQAESAKSVQYQDLDDLGVTSNEIKKLLLKADK
ncbi:hypothetical protein [Psychrobacter sp. UBA3480]|uniref:hypothetical protein n=1 Tax=Psychrobacter sp. UBA3480 TaxID=1947350 RepID=UPI0025FF76CD|nr:hypothetical protein [Psychrobacter sp. UBA3480]